jgi:exodeoxyribonuclease-3
MAQLRVLSWNIRHGGGARTESIARAIAAHAPDVAVLIEFRTIPGRELRRLLKAAGYRHAVEAPLEPRQNGVAIVSRTKLVESERLGPSAVPKHRWLEVEVPRHKISIAAFYGPLEDVPYGAWWTSVREVMADRVKMPFVLAGDFNTGMSVVDAPRDPFYCAEHFQALQDMGMSDVWRRTNPKIREYSWYSRRAGRDLNGFRLDHILASPPLAARLRDSRYSHAEREANTSDHSILLADFDRPETSTKMELPYRSGAETRRKPEEHLW